MKFMILFYKLKKNLDTKIDDKDVFCITSL